MTEDDKFVSNAQLPVRKVITACKDVLVDIVESREQAKVAMVESYRNRGTFLSPRTIEKAQAMLTATDKSIIANIGKDNEDRVQRLLALARAVHRENPEGTVTVSVDDYDIIRRRYARLK